MIVAAVRMNAAGGGEHVEAGLPHHWFIHSFIPQTLTERLLYAGRYWGLSNELGHGPCTHRVPSSTRVPWRSWHDPITELTGAL